ncbi:hypothetical protein PN4B1_49190 [Paenibacillus naphthalenovorans]|jgi:uncharacterized protein YndB with AHSA1/START domain|uniref:SRPBCC domain-containing protein n=1 Tax=Paenibacillus naphthalenovorans TaxID=162209 RepID=UPI0010B925A3|nr:SRPBCC domain-containing protein [Paenibacillus naphthalenovorans]GCL74925.1 hypothetical protein PN4B1_49190 [Paenibacillus naphthalenovorans]
MNNQTKIEIRKPAADIFEAFVDPVKIGNYWFSSGSERWAKGKTVTLRYEEYDAQGDIHVLDMIDHHKIVYEWGREEGEPHTVTITFHATSPETTVVEVTEEGFDDRDPDLIPKLIDNKEGWVFMLTCLKGYLEFGVNRLRSALVK